MGAVPPSRSRINYTAHLQFHKKQIADFLKHSDESMKPISITLPRFLLLSELNELHNKARQRAVRLRVPKAQQQDTPFIDASLAHFYASLERWENNYTEIILYFNDGPDIDDYCRTLSGMTLAFGTIPVKFLDNTDARPRLYSTAQTILKEYQERGFDILPEEFRRKESAFFISCKTAGFGTPGFFDIKGGGKPIPRGVFLMGQEALLEFLTSKYVSRGRVALARNDLLQRLGIVFHELLTNASKFAQQEVDGRPIPRVFRSLSYRFFTPAASRSQAEDPAISNYLSNLGGSHTRFLEVCFWDSGPGLARHFLHHSQSVPCEDLEPSSITPSKEITGAITCFTKLRSAEVELGQGFGLNDTIRELSKVRGFIRVRTGRLDLYRDLASQPYDLTTANDPISFQHLHTQSAQPSFTGWAWGCLYSVIVPWK